MARSKRQRGTEIELLAYFDSLWIYCYHMGINRIVGKLCQLLLLLLGLGAAVIRNHERILGLGIIIQGKMDVVFAKSTTAVDAIWPRFAILVRLVGYAATWRCLR